MSAAVLLPSTSRLHARKSDQAERALVDLSGLLCERERLGARGVGGRPAPGAEVDDALDGGPSADQLVGGDGVDSASYATRTSAVAITLDGAANDGDDGDEAHGSRDNAQTEDVVGGSGNDAVTGSETPNRLEGRLGDDMLRGGSAGDDLRGGDGRDDLGGEDGGDILDGGGATDVLSAGAGNDTLRTLEESPDQDGW